MGRKKKNIEIYDSTPVWAVNGSNVESGEEKLINPDDYPPGAGPIYMTDNTSYCASMGNSSGPSSKSSYSIEIKKVSFIYKESGKEVSHAHNLMVTDDGTVYKFWRTGTTPPVPMPDIIAIGISE